MGEVEIPCYFLCPISMQLMKDPVTVATGITYDRDNIEKWLFSCKNNICPVSKQPLTSAADLTPNHTLRRLIQSWCTLNAHDRIPTPKPSLDKAQIVNLLDEARNSPTSHLHCLRRLRSIAVRNESCRSHLQAAGAVSFLLSVVGGSDGAAREEALTTLQEMELSDSDLKPCFAGDGKILNALIEVLNNGDAHSRSRAVTLLRAAFAVAVADPTHVIGSRREIFAGAVKILQERASQQATKAAVKLLTELCPWGKNRFKAVEAGAVAALVELLLETAERRMCELGLTALEQLCSCADGRAELLRHGAGVAVVSKRILRVSGVASDRAVRIVGSISKYSANSRVLQEMAQVGVVAKLCLVMQVEGGITPKTKERVREILRLHSRVWRESSCIPRHLLSSYPS